MQIAHVFFRDDAGALPARPLAVQVAQSPAELRQGLLGRPYLDDGTGMLFDMGAEGQHVFHTIGLGFPIDILFVSGDQRVTTILHNVMPGTPAVGADGRWVVEAPGGWAARNALTVGMAMSFG